MSRVPERTSISGAGRAHAAARPARMRRMAAFCVVAAVVVLVDQLTKEYMLDVLADGSRRTLIPHVMDLLLVHNTGAAFSMGEGSGWLFVAIAIVVVAGAAAFVWTSPEGTMPLAVVLGLIAGGGVGNMVDRLRLGSVTDFLATSFVRFPVFNVADICVTCGVFAMLVIVWRMDVGE